LYSVFTLLLFIAFVVIVLRYYRPKPKGDLEAVEKPKYDMLRDDDGDGRPGARR
jgi:cbb3-type cytochrome oxidase subunit 3